MTPYVISEILKENAELAVTHASLEDELNIILKSDPQTVARLESELENLISLANKWTDDIFILRQYVCSKLKIRESILNDWFNIPADLDLIE